MPWYYDWSSFVFPQSLQKRLFAFLLQRGIGQFLDDELDVDNLNLQLGNGAAEIHNVALNVETLNKTLHGLALSVKSGYIGRVRAKIPWKNPLMGDYEIEAHSVSIELVGNPDPESQMEDDIEQSLGDIASSTILAKDFIHEQSDVLHQHTSTRHDIEIIAGDSASSPTVLSRIIDRIVDNLKVTITQLNIKVILSEHLPSVNILVPAITIANDHAESIDEQTEPAQSRIKKLMISGLEIHLDQTHPDSSASSSTSSLSGQQYASAIDQSVYLDSNETIASAMASMLLQQPPTLRRIVHMGQRPISASIKLTLSPLHPPDHLSDNVYSRAAFVTQVVSIDLGAINVELHEADIHMLYQLVSLLTQPVKDNGYESKLSTPTYPTSPLVSLVPSLPIANTSQDRFDLPGTYKSSDLLQDNMSSAIASGLPPETLSILHPADALHLQLQNSSITLKMLYDSSSTHGGASLSDGFLTLSANDAPHLCVKFSNLTADLGMRYRGPKDTKLDVKVGVLLLDERLAESHSELLRCGRDSDSLTSEADKAIRLSVSMNEMSLETDIMLAEITTTLNFKTIHRLRALYERVSGLWNSKSVDGKSEILSKSDFASDSISEGFEAISDESVGSTTRRSRLTIASPSILLCIFSNEATEFRFEVKEPAFKQDADSEISRLSIRGVEAAFQQDSDVSRFCSITYKEGRNSIDIVLQSNLVDISCQRLMLYANSTTVHSMRAFLVDAHEILPREREDLSLTPDDHIIDAKSSSFLITFHLHSSVVILDGGESVFSLNVNDLYLSLDPSSPLSSLHLSVETVHSTVTMGPNTYVILSRLDLGSSSTMKVVDVRTHQTSTIETSIQVEIEKLTFYLHQEQLPTWISSMSSLFSVDLHRNTPSSEGSNDEETSMNSKLTIELLVSDCSVKIIPKGLHSRGILLLQYAEFYLCPAAEAIEVRGSAESMLGLIIDDTSNQKHTEAARSRRDALAYWQTCGYVTMLSIKDGTATARSLQHATEDIQINLQARKVQFDACADSLQSFLTLVTALVPVPEEIPSVRDNDDGLVDVETSSYAIDDDVFRPDTRLNTGQEMRRQSAELSFVEGFFDVNHLAGENEQILDESHVEDIIKTLDDEPLDFVDDFFHQDKFEAVAGKRFHFGESGIVAEANIDTFILQLYDGYDWQATRSQISAEIVKVHKKALLQHQLVAQSSAAGADKNTNDDDLFDTDRDEEVSSCLFKSIYVSVPVADVRQDIHGWEADLDKIINELPEGVSSEPTKTASVPSSETASSSYPTRPLLGRSSVHKIRISVEKAHARYFVSDASVTVHQLASHLELFLHRLDIIDNLHTSTWRNFLSPLREDSKNVRETNSSMAHIDLQSVRPTLKLDVEEVRLFAHIQPVRLHVDQDALEFLKRFFAFKAEEETDKGDHQDASPPAPTPTAAYIQYVKIKPIRVKLDYKPKFVDYKALRGGQTTEVMNFFHFESAMMTLKEVTMSGVTGWPKMFNDLNDIWMPDIKATQLSDVISGVSPIRSVVNIGSGVADLVLLPIEHYKRDGHVLRGIRKGSRSFAKATTMEAIKLGTKLAAGTQVILEKAEEVLAIEGDRPSIKRVNFDRQPVREVGSFSKMADPPLTLVEGVQGAYQAISTNVSGAAHTIFAVPVETYQRTGPQGGLKAVVRAVPVAVIKPMIGATEAVTKTLLGLKNSIDPEERLNGEEKYKSRGL